MAFAENVGRGVTLWTTTERNYMMERYKLDGPAKIAKHLGRTSGGVMAMVGRMGISARFDNSEYINGELKTLLKSWAG